MTQLDRHIESIRLACQEKWPGAEKLAVTLTENAWCQPGMDIIDNLFRAVAEPSGRRSRLDMVRANLGHPRPRWGLKRRVAWRDAFRAATDLVILSSEVRP